MPHHLESADDWISIAERDGEVVFEVRQRRLLRLVRWSALLVLGLVCFGGIIGLFLASPRYVSETAAGAIGFILLLVGVYFLFAAISGLFPALWALKEASTVRFAVTPNGIRQDRSEAGRTIPFENASGPYYVDLQTRGTAQAPMKGKASMVYVGAGIGGVAAAGSIATAQAAGNLVGQGVRLGIEQVLRGSAGQVFIEDKAKRVYLARLLEDGEARFLSEKLAAAIQKMAPSGT